MERGKKKKHWCLKYWALNPEIILTTSTWETASENAIEMDPLTFPPSQPMESWNNKVAAIIRGALLTAILTKIIIIRCGPVKPQEIFITLRHSSSLLAYYYILLLWSINNPHALSLSHWWCGVEIKVWFWDTI